MHCRNWLRISFPLLLVLMFLEYPPSLASDSGYSKYGNFMVDYSSLSGEKLRKEGDEYFVKGYDSPTKAEQEKHYQTAMQNITCFHKYILRIIIHMFNWQGLMMKGEMMF